MADKKATTDPQVKQTSECSQHHGSSDWRERVCDERTYTINEKWASIAVDAFPNGGIDIQGWDKNHIQVVAHISAWDRDKSGAQALLDEITIVTSDGLIKTDGPQLKGSRRGFAVDFDVMVPRLSNLNLKTLNGGIGINGVSGDIEARAVNGGLTLAELSGDVSIHTDNGSVSVTLDGSTWQGSGLNVSTTNGSLKIYLPKNYSAELETQTVNGSMDIGFPIQVHGKIGKTIQTVLGSGGPKIKFSTVNGSVKLVES